MPIEGVAVVRAVEFEDAELVRFPLVLFRSSKREEFGPLSYGVRNERTLEYDDSYGSILASRSVCEGGIGRRIANGGERKA